MPRKIQHLASIVGTNISFRRRLKNLSQAELAEKIDIGPDTLSRVENGIVAPRFPRLEALAKALDCSVADLFRAPSEPLSSHIQTIHDYMKHLHPDLHIEIVKLVEQAVLIINKQASLNTVAESEKHKNLI